MSAKKATKVYHISADSAQAAEKAEEAIREMLERIGAEEDGGDGATATAWRPTWRGSPAP